MSSFFVRLIINLLSNPEEVEDQMFIAILNQGPRKIRKYSTFKGLNNLAIT